MPEEGVGMREGQHAVPGRRLVAHEDHLHRQNEIPSATLILLGFVGVEMVHMYKPEFLHESGDTPSVFEIDDQGQHRRLTHARMICS